MCRTQFKTIGHSLKNLAPSQKTLRLMSSRLRTCATPSATDSISRKSARDLLEEELINKHKFLLVAQTMILIIVFHCVFQKGLAFILTAACVPHCPVIVPSISKR